MSHLIGLNEKQKEAVLSTEGPVLIIAGAGAGKTKTITSRITHLIHQGVQPKSILAITFTNKAAKEMQERVAKALKADLALSYDTERPWIGTFHSLGVKIIKENAHLIGLTKNFSIFDRDDSKKAVRQAIIDCGLDPKQFEPRKILSAISREKSNLVTLETFEERSHGSFTRSIASKVWRLYEKTLFQEKALDFDDLLVKAVEILRNKEVREKYSNTWKYVHVDEYQDTNKAQYEMVRLILDNNRNICVVGDIDQMIYSWRGADIENILNFEEDFPDAKVVTLEQNYRSTKTILAAANSVIIQNKKRRDKKLFTDNTDGEKISLYRAYDEQDEANFIAQMADKLIKKGVDPKEIAVLFRANFQSRALEEGFLRHNIPYQIVGTRFFERKEIKDVLSFIKASLSPDSTADLKRIINVPPRGIGKITLLKVLEGREDELTGKAFTAVKEMRALLAKIKEKIETEKPSEIIKFIIKGSGLDASLASDDPERLENVMELASLALKYDHLPIGEGIENLLTEAALASDQDDLIKNESAVKLMTVHASKGLEFDYIFITGLEDGLFPHKALDERKDEEEERRLFYVAVTRSRKKVYLISASLRTIFGSKQVNVPSEFLLDIEEEHMEEVTRRDILGESERSIEY